jgi:hypothetical protein
MRALGTFVFSELDHCYSQSVQNPRVKSVEAMVRGMRFSANSYCVTPRI